MRQERLEALGVLATRGSSRPELGPHGERHLRRPAGHERELGGLVEELVETDAEEIEVHHLDHGAHSGHRRTHREADDRRLRDRGVSHAGTELVRQAPGEPEDVASRTHVDAGHEYPVVCRQLGAESGSDGVHGAEHGRILRGRRRF